jgi:hypothetical protein
MRDKDAAGHSGPFQHFKIGHASQLRISRRGEINGGLPQSNRPDDVEIEVGVGLKANTQTRESPVTALAF